ncbi:hypothetical protein L9F63_011956, partial [Diploptera punctata]
GGQSSNEHIGYSVKLAAKTRQRNDFITNSYTSMYDVGHQNSDYLELCAYSCLKVEF